jgi:hypothetical protein
MFSYLFILFSFSRIFGCEGSASDDVIIDALLMAKDGKHCSYLNHFMLLTF